MPTLRHVFGLAVRQTDATLMRAARALAPPDHTTGDRFRHGPAPPLFPWLALGPTRALGA